MTHETNGHLKSRLDSIEKGVYEIKDDLSQSIDRLSVAVDRLSDKFEAFLEIAESSMPIKAVVWLMGLMVLGLIGIEGTKNLGPALKHIWGL